MTSQEFLLMNIQTLEQSPRNHRGGQVSHLLLAAGQFGSESLAVTWVEGEPGSEQAVHSHEGREQVYVVVQGRGAMRVGDEVEEVGPGTAILVPPGTSHSIRNIGEEKLIYVSSTSPPFEMQEGNTRWSAPAGS
jgi:mannose-6-phosphate isomerase-like protein (cupin superfamily)